MTDRKGSEQKEENLESKTKTCQPRRMNTDVERAISFKCP